MFLISNQQDGKFFFVIMPFSAVTVQIFVQWSTEAQFRHSVYELHTQLFIAYNLYLSIYHYYSKKFQKDLDNNSPRWAKDSTQK